MKNAYSFYLFLIEHTKILELKNCEGLQESSHNCLLKGEGLSEERVEDLCGCQMNQLLQCKLVAWIKHIQEDLALRLKENSRWKYNMYFTDTEHTCANRNQIYQWDH